MTEAKAQAKADPMLLWTSVRIEDDRESGVKLMAVAEMAVDEKGLGLRRFHFQPGGLCDHAHGEPPQHRA